MVRVALLAFVTFVAVRTIHAIWTVEEREPEGWQVFGSSVTKAKRIFATVLAGVVGLVLWLAVLFSE